MLKLSIKVLIVAFVFVGCGTKQNVAPTKQITDEERFSSYDKEFKNYIDKEFESLDKIKNSNFLNSKEASRANKLEASKPNSIYLKHIKRYLGI